MLQLKSVKVSFCLLSFDMLCTENFLFARTYLINYIYIGF